MPVCGADLVGVIGDRFVGSRRRREIRPAPSRVADFSTPSKPKARTGHLFQSLETETETGIETGSTPYGVEQVSFA
jgi:hypothetical protein